MNHVAYEVDDVEALRERMKSAGYKDSTPPNVHSYRKRQYFYDPEGNDLGVRPVPLSPAERNDYKLPDRIAHPRSGLRCIEAVGSE